MSSPNEIVVGPSIPAEQLCRATASIFVPTPYAPGYPSAGQRIVAPIGRTIAAGQLVPISDPVVRKHPEFFETVSRPLTLADIDAAEAVREIEREAS